MKNNSLSIHIESGDIFYRNFNTGKKILQFYTCTFLYILYLIYKPTKMQNICSIGLMITLKYLPEKDKPSSIP